MFKSINLDNNDPKNGYIYKLLTERMDELENKIKQVYTLMEVANDEMKISLNDYVGIIKKINDNISREEFERHTLDSKIHIHKSKTLIGQDPNTNEYKYNLQTIND